MNLFTCPLFCCTMILPVIFVGHRVVKGVPYNSIVVSNAYKQYKCARKVFRSQTIDCKKGIDWPTRWVETQQNIYVVKCFMIGQ